MNDPIKRVSTVSGLTISCGHEWMAGGHRFRRVDNQYYLEVGLGNWARTSEPIVGKKVGSCMRKGMIFYGDPSIYELTWTEYEEIGALDDTFFVVCDDDKGGHRWHEMPSYLRPAFEASDIKRTFHNLPDQHRSVRYLRGHGSRDQHDRSRDNPTVVIYLTNETT
jgi:hypothetical protein